MQICQGDNHSFPLNIDERTIEVIFPNRIEETIETPPSGLCPQGNSHNAGHRFLTSE
jgi:hypothetical protein